MNTAEQTETQDLNGQDVDMNNPEHVAALQDIQNAEAEVARKRIADYELIRKQVEEMVVTSSVAVIKSDDKPTGTVIVTLTTFFGHDEVGVAYCHNLATFDQDVGQRMAYEDAIGKLIANVRFFQKAQPHLTDLKSVARIAHNATLAICDHFGHEAPAAEWDELSDELRESSLRGVIEVATNPQLDAEDIHAAWAVQRMQDGWSYGAVKDPELKLHPCLVGFAELPADQRLKSEVFGAIVRGALNRSHDGASQPEAQLVNEAAEHAE